MKHILYLFLVTLLLTPLSAQDEKFQLSRVTYDGINEAQKFLDANNTHEAEKRLLALSESKKIRKKLDKAYVRFYLGYFYTLDDKSNKAIEYFESSLEYKALAPEQTSNAYLNLIQLSMELEAYQEAMKYLDALISITNPPKSQYFVYKANIEMINKAYVNVIENINEAIAIEGKAKADWLKMQFYSYYMLDDFSNAINVLKKLIEMEPKNREYWLQLSSLYSVTEDFSKSLSSLDISRIAELDLNESELLRLISWLRYSNVPYKAAGIMQEKLKRKIVTENEKNYNTLGDLYYEAKAYQKAISWYQKSADLTHKSSSYFKIAKIYANEHNYKEVVTYIKRSLKQVDSKNEGDKYLLLGKAYYELKEPINAKKSFLKAKKYEKSKKMATAWLNYID
ncbi:MAG: hypothetical protein U9N52_13050 [Campylobacterota bacterium]|nr:hypothetical protein [Campylobacterota bacterium]